MRIDHQQLSIVLLQRRQLVAQLRELPVADRSRVAVNEHEYHSLLAAKVAESVGLAGCRD